MYKLNLKLVFKCVVSEWCIRRKVSEGRFRRKIGYSCRKSNRILWFIKCEVKIINFDIGILGLYDEKNDNKIDIKKCKMEWFRGLVI